MSGETQAGESSPLAPFSITLQSSADGTATFVGAHNGVVISDEELRSESPQLGRALVLLRRMGDIMVRTADARGRRGALLTELAECFWNRDMSVSLGADSDELSHTARHVGPRPVGRTLGSPEPVIDASAIWSSPE